MLHQISKRHIKHKKVAKAANIFQLIGQVASKYMKHYSLKEKLNAHIDGAKPCIP